MGDAMIHAAFDAPPASSASNTAATMYSRSATMVPSSPCAAKFTAATKSGMTAAGSAWRIVTLYEGPSTILK
jgi:hypothetical protein